MLRLFFQLLGVHIWNDMTSNFRHARVGVMPMATFIQKFQYNARYVFEVADHADAVLPREQHLFLANLLSLQSKRSGPTILGSSEFLAGDNEILVNGDQYCSDWGDSIQFTFFV